MEELNYKSQNYNHSMGKCLEEALLFQILINIMENKIIAKKIKRWVCSSSYMFYGPRFITHQRMIEKVLQILMLLVLAHQLEV